MRKKVMILLTVIVVTALVFVIGSSMLYQKSRESRKEEISISEIDFYLSVADEETADGFLQQCDEIQREKGYLPKEETMQSLITYMNEMQPELEMDYREAGVVSVSGNTLLAKTEQEEFLQEYTRLTRNEAEETSETPQPGDIISVFGTKDKILNIVEIREGTVLLKTAWVKGNTENKLTVRYGDNEFALANCDREYNGYEDIVDITVKDGGAALVTAYTDKINAKLLSVRDGKIELEGAGIFPYTEHMQVYKLYGEYEPYTLADLKIGYAFTDFVLNDKKEIVAALVSGEGYLDKIRVVVKTTGFESPYHESVVLCCDTDMEWSSGDKSGVTESGTELEINVESEMFDSTRICFSPVALSAKIKLPSVERNQGTPSYRGTIEIEKTPDGLLVINELLLDEYLYSVVPSEMPASYPLEALKAQAVSARTYAYAHMNSSSLQSYGAHVDDSAAFQVYNNISENDMTTRAVRETEGIIVCKNQKPVTTYFYSTSCGYGTDLSAWMAENDDYLRSHKIGEGNSLDLTDNVTFDEYIRGRDLDCYEVEETYFRWKYETAVNEELLLENLKKRYQANPQQVLTGTEEGFVSREIDAFGELTDIAVIKRAGGGAVTGLLLIGTENTIKILSEKNARYILAGENTKLSYGENYSKEGKADGMLPSAFLTIEPELKDGKITALRIFGGGFGHGIGMSQNGAKQMAKRGMGFDEILSFFYAETELEEMKKEEK